MNETKVQVSNILGFLTSLKQDLDEINARNETTNSKTDEKSNKTTPGPVPKIKLIRKGSKWDIVDRKFSLEMN